MGYYLMHKDQVIAKADDYEITEIENKDLCPVCVKVGTPLSHWLEYRCVDIHRSHSRQLFKALRLQNNVSIDKIIEVGHGITITDNWWIQKDDENLDYASLRSYNKAIADIALFGSSRSHMRGLIGYTELGTIGSYEKAWRYIDNEWYMFKQGNNAELLSEYYSYVFLKTMKAPVAQYRIFRQLSKETGLETVCIVSKDFTDNGKYDFEPFCYLFGDNEDPQYIALKLDKELRKQYVMMLFYDAHLFNGDRHNQNVGILRDSETGKTVGLAPFFDYNMSLAATNNIPRCDRENGNIFTRGFYQSREIADIVSDFIPTKEEIENAAATASAETKAAFPNINFNYSIFENYIFDTYSVLLRDLHNAAQGTSKSDVLDLTQEQSSGRK